MTSRRQSAPKGNSSNQKLPPWITDHFTESLDTLDRLGRIVHISERGIAVLRGLPKVVKVLADVKGTAAEADSQEKLKVAEEEAELAKSEIELGFPVLHGLAVVALWSWTENFVKGFVALWLLNRKDAIAAPVVQKLRIKLGEYLKLSKSEQAHYIVELIEQETAGSLRRGGARFESLLEPFALSGAIPDECAKALFELQQVRNAVAHRNGKADRRLRTSCPWLKVKQNAPLHVDRKMLNGYYKAVSEYLLVVLFRIGDKYGHDLRPEGTT